MFSASSLHHGESQGKLKTVTEALWLRFKLRLFTHYFVFDNTPVVSLAWNNVILFERTGLEIFLEERTVSVLCVSLSVGNKRTHDTPVTTKLYLKFIGRGSDGLKELKDENFLPLRTGNEPLMEQLIYCCHLCDVHVCYRSPGPTTLTVTPVHWPVWPLTPVPAEAEVLSVIFLSLPVCVCVFKHSCRVKQTQPAWLWWESQTLCLCECHTALHPNNSLSVFTVCEEYGAII